MTSPLSVRIRKYCPTCGSLQVTKLIRKHAYHCNICDWEGEGVTPLPTVHLMTNGRAKHVTKMYLSLERGGIIWRFK